MAETNVFTKMVALYDRADWVVGGSYMFHTLMVLGATLIFSERKRHVRTWGCRGNSLHLLAYSSPRHPDPVWRQTG